MLPATTICVSLFTLSVALAATTTTRPQEAVTSDNTRIVGGQDATSTSMFPYQVSLRYNNNHRCGASIIDDKNILTAAHCVVDDYDKALKASAFTIVAGELFLSSTSTTRVTRDVRNIFVHEKYDSYTMSNDIAILRIDSLGNFTTDSVNSVPLATATMDDNTACVITGWGVRLEGSQYASNTLQYAGVTTLSLTTCNVAYNYTLPNGVVCAGHWDGRIDSCQGDSGGPLVCNGEQLGIVSFGFGCARPGYPGVYTDVSQFSSWIKTQQARDGATLSLVSLYLIIFCTFSISFL